MSATDYIVKQIRFMCMSFKGRLGGSPQEWKCQDYIREETGRFADKVEAQTITVHPDVGWAWLIVVAACGLLSLIVPLFGLGNTVLVSIGFGLSLLAVVIGVGHFVMGFHLLDRFFPARKAQNVMASVAPQGEVRQRIVFCGHADAAVEMYYSHLGGELKVLRVAATSALSLVLTFALNLGHLLRHIIVGRIARGSVIFWLRIASLVMVPAFIEALFFFNTRCVVDGANDNLSGCAVAMAALRELSMPRKKLRHTEVCCLTTSSEESGLRGAHAFARDYARENDGVDTIFVVLDTLRDVNQMKIYDRGMNGLQRNSQEVAALIRQSAQGIGLDLPNAGFYPGATDAEAFSRAGLKACAICGVDHIPQAYYHTRADNMDNIDPDCLDLSLRLCMEIASQYDQGCMDTAEIGLLHQIA